MTLDVGKMTEQKNTLQTVRLTTTSMKIVFWNGVNVLGEYYASIFRI